MLFAVGFMMPVYFNYCKKKPDTRAFMAAGTCHAVMEMLNMKRFTSAAAGIYSRYKSLEGRKEKRIAALGGAARKPDRGNGSRDGKSPRRHGKNESAAVFSCR